MINVCNILFLFFEYLFRTKTLIIFVVITIKEVINATNEFNYINKIKLKKKKYFYNNINNKLDLLKNKFYKNLIKNLLFKKDYNIIDDLFNMYYNYKLENIKLGDIIIKKIIQI